MNGESLKDRVPPHNTEAEAATLGAILLDPEALGRVLVYLRSDDFYRNANARIFQAILNLSERAEEIDIITVTQELRAEGALDNVGGSGYVSSLTGAVPTSANVEYYARIVKESSLRRKLLRVSNEIIATIYDDTRESRKVVEEAERRIFDIADNQHTESFRKAKDIVQETVEAIERLYKTKDSYTGVPSGFPDLDNMLSGFQDSELIIIGARPSVGKTALALTMAAHMAIHQHIPVGFFTAEMSNMALMQRLIASEARIGSQTIRTGMLKPSDFKSLTDAAGLIYESPLWINDTPNIPLLDLRAQARRMVAQQGIRVLFVDYITLITSENTELPRHEQVAEISRSLKALARELRVPIIALSQLTRDSEGKRPSLASIRESGSIEQDADVVIFLHRERGSERTGDEHPSVVETELVVAKQRNGPVGTVKIAFVPKYTKFESLRQEPV
ncbi:MAG: replicative DNA helicase [Spirochaetes bacterium]|jgi:replicative DNA helicase|nr:replicative DNA helicase [Spirochaetota bacterium]